MCSCDYRIDLYRLNVYPKDPELTSLFSMAKIRMMAKMCARVIKLHPKFASLLPQESLQRHIVSVLFKEIHPDYFANIPIEFSKRYIAE